MRNFTVKVNATVLGHQSKTTKGGETFYVSTVFDYENQQALEITGLDPVKYPANTHVSMQLAVYARERGGLGVRLESAQALKAA